MKGMKKLFSASLLCLLFTGCAALPCGDKKVPETGGITDYTDVSAPKEIVSKNIVSFSTKFFIRDKYDDEKAGQYDIKIADNEIGEHVLTVKGVYDYELTVGDHVLADVQAIIDQQELVKRNGAGRVTAGLPVEWEPWMLSAVYDSGEKLYFYEDGAPEADWTAAFRDYFVTLLAESGFVDALPPKEAVTIEQFSFAFNIGEEYHAYCLTEQQGSTYLWHLSLDMDTQERKCNEFASVTDSLLDGLQQVIVANGMDALHAPESVHFDLKGSKNGFLEVYVDYVSGRRIYGEYEASELPAEWLEMRAALVDFLDTYIRENSADVQI